MSIKEVLDGKNESVYIIAEIGVNHNGSKEMALEMIDEVVACGANAVKFQTFVSEQLVTPNAKKANYQLKTTQQEESQLEMLKKLELSFDDFSELKDYCYKKGIDFLSTPFDEVSAEFLYSINIDGFKVGSGDMNNIPFLRKLDQYGLPIILSTGMADLEEVKLSLQNISLCPVAVLHCTSEYPAPIEDVNLLAMNTMEQSFGGIVGFSDHTEGVEATLAAVTLGARIIEKHFTLDRNLSGPDHKASMEAAEFAKMVRSIRITEAAMGDGIKRVMPSEESTKKVARKSIITNRRLIPGEIINKSDLSIKRPGTGLEPKYYYELIGKKMTREVGVNHLLTWDDVE